MAPAIAFLAVMLGVTSSAQAGVSAGWHLLTPMAAKRTHAAVVTLRDGRVLVTGGAGASDAATATAELYDPVKDAWLPAGTMTRPRERHTATLLADGRVLVVGGDGIALASAEIYDPKDSSWKATAPLTTSRTAHTATLLPSGRVFVAGGGSNRSEEFDPAGGEWTHDGGMITPRSRHTATLLATGQVLLAGGEATASGEPTAAVEVYDPSTRSYHAADPMQSARLDQTATVLLDGRVLVVGGGSGAELYSPASGDWSQTAVPLFAASEHTATRLDSGEVLIIGGAGGISGNQAQSYDPGRDAWKARGTMAEYRRGHIAAALADGTVLVAGGREEFFGLIVASAERWTPTATLAVDDTLDLDEGQPATLRVRNTGKTPLWLGRFGLSGGSGFTVVADTCSSVRLAPQQECALTLTFAASAAGRTTAALTFPANTAIGAHAVTLVGHAAARDATPEPTPAATPQASPPAVQPPAKAPPSVFVSIPFRNGYRIGEVPRSQACRGRLTVTLLHGRQVLATRRTRLDRHCRYSVTFRIRRSTLAGARRLSVKVRFAGNRRLSPVTNRFTVDVPIA
ncbi:MAG TPA: kelch repeat-containing protein [Solirubrobacter sp.]